MMTNSLRIALVDPDNQSRETLKQLLEGLSHACLEFDCSRYEVFASTVEQSKPDIAMINLDSDIEKALLVLQQINQESPDTSILIVSGNSDGQLILRVIRAGAKEYLTLPIHHEDLEAAIRRVKHHHSSVTSEERHQCDVTAIAGANGGVGSTSTAINLGCALAQDSQNSVAVLDLDLALGDADVFLDLIPEYTLSDVVQNANRLDVQLLRKSMTRHETGLFLLPRPVDLMEAEYISNESLTHVLTLMKECFTHLIIDLSKSYNELDKIAMESSNRILLLTQLDLPCLRNAVRMLMNFDESDELKEKVQVVVNRSGFEAGQISMKKATETLNRDIFFQIPNDFRTMVDCRNNGVPLVIQSSRAAITNAFRRLAEEVTHSTNEPIVIPDVTSVSHLGWKRFWPGVQQ